MSDIVLFGIGSPICADVVESCRRNGLRIAAALRNLPGEVYVGADVPVLDADQATPTVIGLPFFLPMYDPQSRRVALAAATKLGFREAAQLVDRTAIVASDCTIGPGVYINAGCIVGAGSRLERFAFCNRGANLGHHCRIGAFASVGPGAVLCGSASIGEDSQIGAGAVLLPKVRVGSAAVIAPGAVVTRDVPDHGLAAGNPARIMARPPVVRE